MKETILVTGAAGRLGQALVKELAKRKFKVRVLDRDKLKCQELFGKTCDAIQLDLAGAHINEIYEACYGCSQVVHLAALLNGSEEDLLRVNYEGTKKLVAAARKAGVQRFILTSSTAVYGNPRGLVKEEGEKKPVDSYGKSKLLAEEAVKSGGVPWVIIRPSVIYGHVQGFNRGFREVVKMVQAGKMPLVGKGDNNIPLVHVDDLVNAFVLVLEKNWIENEDFIIAGPKVSQKQAVNLVAETLGVPKPSKKLSRTVAYLAAGAADAFNSLKGKRSSHKEYVRVLTEDRVFSTEKAEKVLGWKPRVDFKKAAPAIIKEFSKN